MKKLFPSWFLPVLLFGSIVALGGTFSIAVSSCAAPSARTTQVTTLKVLGASVDTTMQVAAQALKNGQISKDQWLKIAAIHDQKFLPAYNLAVAAVQANLDSVASPDLIALAAQLASLVPQYHPSTP